MRTNRHHRVAMTRTFFAALVCGIPARTALLLRTSIGLAFTALVVPIAQADDAYQCYVSTKDAGVQTVVVQAASQDAAKIAALQQFGARAFGMIGVTCQPGGGGQLILSKNPQLSKIPDWPQGTGVGEPTDCDKDAMQKTLDYMRKAGETAFRCVVFQGKFGGQAWESGSGEVGLYQLQLHPNSPIVWRVYKRDEIHLISLIAEFDASGKLVSSQSARSPSKLLAGTSASQPSRAQGQSEIGSARLPGETRRECLDRLCRGCRESSALVRACSSPTEAAPAPSGAPMPPKEGPRR